MWGDTPGEVAGAPQPALPTLEPCWVHFIKKVYEVEPPRPHP